MPNASGTAKISARTEVTQRAVDRDGGAEHLLHRVPVGGAEEAEAELAERRQVRR